MPVVCLVKPLQNGFPTDPKNPDFDNFTPDPADTFQLIDLTSGTASNWFSSVVAPTGWTLSSGGLLAVPEPSTALLLCLGLMALAAGRWNR